MTKVIILGEQPKDQEKKKIEFVKCVNTPVDADNHVIGTLMTPDCFETVELICKSGAGTYDIMFAYDKKRNDGVLYLGHFNDGII